MPYIKQNRRDKLDPLIEKLDNELKNEGEVNYAITRIIDGHYGTDSYTSLNAGVGVLSCVAQEFYRRRIVPFESKRRLENGEVFE